LVREEGVSNGRITVADARIQVWEKPVNQPLKIKKTEAVSAAYNESSPDEFKIRIIADWILREIDSINVAAVGDGNQVKNAAKATVQQVVDGKIRIEFINGPKAIDAPQIE
jgi:hypothetical protein